MVSFSDDDLPLDSDGESTREDTRRVQIHDVKDDAPPGPNVVPEFIPLSAQTPVMEPVCTPTTHDRPVRVPIDEIPPTDDVMFDPMLGGVARRYSVKSRRGDPENDGWGKTLSAKARGPPFFPCP